MTAKREASPETEAEVLTRVRQVFRRELREGKAHVIPVGYGMAGERGQAMRRQSLDWIAKFMNGDESSETQAPEQESTETPMSEES